MAWVAVDLDDTLIQRVGSPETGEEQTVPTEGAVEAMNQLAQEGHRLTIFTARFAPMPESEKQRLKEQIETDMAQFGFPPMEVWTGTHKPLADVFIDDNAITYDGDWGLALAQLQYMLEERGLIPTVQPGGEEGPPEEGAEDAAQQ